MLKQIAADSIPRALEKAERYRLLNEPEEAESICRDILQIDPENQAALVTLLLAMTDLFPAGGPDAPKALLQRLSNPYAQAYYQGVITERWAKRNVSAGGGLPFAESGLRDAMACYEKAQGLSPAGSNDATLRWNACARFIQHRLTRDPDRNLDSDYGDEAPRR